uniref:Signal recognition particle 19 kDa protein n=1 Tax=Labrus bergylta TaxID=56723 RepID=A0A3Q3NKY2_9LABR
MAHLTENPADKERFICVYPVYINSKKTLAEGRRIPAEKAVENPSCAEIRDVLTAAGLNVYVENKMHPREWNRDVAFRGRVRVQVKQADGNLCQEKFTSRKSDTHTHTHTHTHFPLCDDMIYKRVHEAINSRSDHVCPREPITSLTGFSLLNFELNDQMFCQTGDVSNRFF